MAKFSRQRQTSPNLIVRVFLQDSTSMTGAGKTGIVRTDTSLKINVIRELSASSTNYVGNTSIEDISTLGAYAAPTSANCRFKEVDATNLPGIYEIQLEQSAGGTSDASKFLTGMIRATGVVPCPFEIALGANDENSNAAVAIARSGAAIVRGTCSAGSSTTSINTSSLAPAAAVNDQFKGRVIIFSEDTTTANLRGQAAAISGSTSGGVLTVSALTDAPASGDTFVIV